jgi:hypothetical protein
MFNSKKIKELERKVDMLEWLIENPAPYKKGEIIETLSGQKRIITNVYFTFTDFCHIENYGMWHYDSLEINNKKQTK